MNWTHDRHDGVDVLSVTGFLHDEVTDRFTAAVRWVHARTTGPLVIDLTALSGWSPRGEQALRDAVEQLLNGPGPLAVCGLESLTHDQVLPPRLGPVLTFPDLAAALSALSPPS